jgi:hypothetical protein
MDVHGQLLRQQGNVFNAAGFSPIVGRRLPVRIQRDARTNRVRLCRLGKPKVVLPLPVPSSENSGILTDTHHRGMAEGEILLRKPETGRHDLPEETVCH